MYTYSSSGERRLGNRIKGLSITSKSIYIKIVEICCLGWDEYFVPLRYVLLCVFDNFYSQTQQKD